MRVSFILVTGDSVWLTNYAVRFQLCKVCIDGEKVPWPRLTGARIHGIVMYRDSVELRIGHAIHVVCKFSAGEFVVWVPMVWIHDVYLQQSRVRNDLGKGSARRL